MPLRSSTLISIAFLDSAARTAVSQPGTSSFPAISSSFRDVTFRYRTLVVALKLRITLLALAGAAFLCAQSASDLALEDPSVLRAKMALEKVRGMVDSGTLPRVRLEEAQTRLEDVTDEAIYTRAIYGKDLTPDQASEVVKATERRVARRKAEAAKQEQYLAQGIISQSEYKVALDDLDRVNKEYEWASAREKLVAEVANFAAAEVALMKQMEEGATQPSGGSMEHFVGKGVFTTADFSKVSKPTRCGSPTPCRLARMAKPPFTARWASIIVTALTSRSTPDSAEGQWLRHFLTVTGFLFLLSVALSLIRQPARTSIWDRPARVMCRREQLPPLSSGGN